MILNHFTRIFKSRYGSSLLFLAVLPVLRDASSASTIPSDDIVGMNLAELVQVKISPFDVSTALDQGYRASNSVSASRFDTPIKDLPFAIQAFTESFIEDQQPVDIFDVVKYSPGVTYRSNDFNEGNANVAIRGFAVSGTQGNVQILRDGFHGPSIFDFTNISRVEVVKGPSSFLYGQVAPGGIVNIITKSPQSEFSATATTTYGSYDQYRFEADITGPITNKLFYRLATSYDEDIHYWDPYDAHSYDIAPSLLWQPYERLSISLKYEYFKKIEEPQVMQKPGYGTQIGAVPTPGDPNLSGVDVPGLPDNWNSMSDIDYRHSRTESVSVWADLKVNDHWDLRTGFSHTDYSVDALFSGNFGMANNATFLQGRRLRRQTYTNEDDTYESQAVGKYQFEHMSLRLLLGAQYSARSFEALAGQAPNDPALGTIPTASPLPLWDLRDPSTWNRAVSIPISALTESPSNRFAEFDDRAVYGGATFGFFDDRLLVLAGWRKTMTESVNTDRISDTESTIEASRLTPQYGVLAKITRSFSLFASYAESFVPGAQPLIVNNVAAGPAAPTTGQGFDTGLKFDLFDGRVSGTLTYFDVRNQNIINDLVSLDPSTGSLLITSVQSGEQRSRGVELDTTLSLTPNWQLYFSYSYMDARIVEFSGRDEAILAQDPTTLNAAELANYKNVRRFHGAPLQMSAPHLANLWTRYNFTNDGLRGLYVAGGVNFVYDQTLLPDTPDSAHQTYTLFGATIGYTWKWRGRPMSLSLTGKNLTDEYYRPSQSSRARPREFLLTFKVKF